MSHFQKYCFLTLFLSFSFLSEAQESNPPGPKGGYVIRLTEPLDVKAGTSDPLNLVEIIYTKDNKYTVRIMPHKKYDPNNWYFHPSTRLEGEGVMDNDGNIKFNVAYLSDKAFRGIYEHGEFSGEINLKTKTLSIQSGGTKVDIPKHYDYRVQRQVPDNNFTIRADAETRKFKTITPISARKSRKKCSIYD